MIDDLTDKELIESLCSIESGLTVWELGFVEEMASQVIKRNEELAPGQRTKAEQIYDERF